MLLTVLVIAAVWTFVSVLVVGCCVSAAQGEGAGWSTRSQVNGGTKILQSATVRARAPRRSRNVA